MTVVISNLYMGTVISYMTVIKLKLVPNSISLLVSNYENDKQQCQMKTLKNHPMLHSFYVRKHIVNYSILNKTWNQFHNLEFYQIILQQNWWMDQLTPRILNERSKGNYW